MIEVGTWRLFTSDGKENSDLPKKVISVVKLKSDVTFTKNENDTWDLSI